MQWIRGQWGRFMRWFPTAHPGAQIGVLLGALVFVPIFLCCSGGLILGASPLGQQLAAQSDATSTAQAVANAQATQQAQVYLLTHPGPTATATSAPAATDAPTVTPSPAPTATNTPAPTATPRPAPTATPRPAPTATPKPTCSTGGAPPNPWCYTFNYTGKLIYSPPSAFCDYFNCIPSFWTYTNGYVEECVDGTYSHSGGVSGSCSHHSGNWRPLYRP